MSNKATYYCQSEAVHGLIAQYGNHLQDMPVQDKLFLRATLSIYQYQRFMIEENEQESVFSLKHSLDEAIEKADPDSWNLMPKTVDWLIKFVMDEEENQRSDQFEGFLKALNDAIEQHL